MERIEELRETIAVGDRVEQLINTPDWKMYIQPLMDKMITDVMGGKVNKRWVDAPGALNESTMDIGQLKYYLGYKAGLIQFHQRIMQFIDERDDALKQLETMKLESTVKKESYSEYEQSDYITEEYNGKTE